MSDLKNKRYFRILLSILLCVPFFLFWWFILLISSISYNEGFLSVFEDAFGKWAVWLGLIGAFLAFSSILYLRFFIKKEWIVHLIAYGMTISFFIFGLVFAHAGEEQFRIFTTEKWMNYPARRITMYFNLVEEYNVNGYSSQMIEQLLGKPDNITDDGTYVYDDNHNNAVYVKFDGESALYLYYVE